mmetsp:Transcript_11822/g.27901  ORF Transcript_11822/g.27901 Transcript_11822/m.27901 type:complete len:751 (+) Transcript_11822:55-2307(+)
MLQPGLGPGEPGDDSRDVVAQMVVNKLNSAGDFHALVDSLVFAAVSVLTALLLFSFLRRWFPGIYEFNTQGEAKKAWPRRPGRGFLDWIPASLTLTVDEVQDNVGLDAALLLEFSHFCIKVTAMLGIPLVFILCPVNFFLGQNPKEAQMDRLSRFSISNVKDGSWLLWVYAWLVWMVVYLVEREILVSQERFLCRRFRWLRGLPAPRSTTIMVENLPTRYCSDTVLRKFFEKMFDAPGAISHVHVVRFTEQLQLLLAQLRLKEQDLKEAEEREKSQEVLDLLLQDRQRLAALCQAERLRLTQGAACKEVAVLGPAGARWHAEVIDQDEDRIKVSYDESGRTEWIEKSSESLVMEPMCTDTAFVTFARRKDAEIALRLQYFPDAEDCVASVPPEAEDIRWCDLRKNATVKAAQERLGHLCVLGLYLGFTPFVVAVSSVTNLSHLQEISPLVRQMVLRLPELAAAIEGLLASLALTIFLSFLPSLMMLIFRNFYTLKANAWAQSKLQAWYFWFLVVFILLVTAIGGSILIALEKIVRRPMSIFGTLANHLPSASHFYLNFMVMQWVTHAVNLTRYVNLIKFLMLRMVYSEPQATQLSDEEDEDYYGIGSRSARWAVNLVIGLVFCCIAPVILLLVCLNFMLCRLIYGYLLVYAELPKSDLGGVFFVRQLSHVHYGLLIYVALMVGVLYKQSTSSGPAFMAAGAFVWIIRSRHRFEVNFLWRGLPFAEIVEDESFAKRQAAGGTYMEPELRER